MPAFGTVTLVVRTGARAPGIEFNYAKIGELLFQIGKAKQMRGDRRKRLYAIYKKFNMAANGLDPMSMDIEDQDDGSDIGDDEIESAARLLLRREHQAKTDRERYRKERKRKHIDSDADENEDGDDADRAKPPKQTRKSKIKKRQRVSKDKAKVKKKKQKKAKSL